MDISFELSKINRRIQDLENNDVHMKGLIETQFRTIDILLLTLNIYNPNLTDLYKRNMLIHLEQFEPEGIVKMCLYQQLDLFDDIE